MSVWESAGLQRTNVSKTMGVIQPRITSVYTSRLMSRQPQRWKLRAHVPCISGASKRSASDGQASAAWLAARARLISIMAPANRPIKWSPNALYKSELYQNRATILLKRWYDEDHPARLRVGRFRGSCPSSAERQQCHGRPCWCPGMAGRQTHETVPGDLRRRRRCSELRQGSWWRRQPSAQVPPKG